MQILRWVLEIQFNGLRNAEKEEEEKSTIHTETSLIAEVALLFSKSCTSTSSFSVDVEVRGDVCEKVLLIKEYVIELEGSYTIPKCWIYENWYTVHFMFNKVRWEELRGQMFLFKISWITFVTVAAGYHLRRRYHLCVWKKRTRTGKTLTPVAPLGPFEMIHPGADVALTLGQWGRGAHGLPQYFHLSPVKPPGLESVSECQHWRQSLLHNVRMPVCQDYGETETQRKIHFVWILIRLSWIFIVEFLLKNNRKT